MKSGTNAVGLWIVGGVTAMIFSFLWWNIPDLANSLMTVPRFAFTGWSQSQFVVVA